MPGFSHLPSELCCLCLLFMHLQTSLAGALDTIAAAVKQLVCAQHVVRAGSHELVLQAAPCTLGARTPFLEHTLACLCMPALSCQSSAVLLDHIMHSILKPVG